MGSDPIMGPNVAYDYLADFSFRMVSATFWEMRS